MAVTIFIGIFMTFLFVWGVFNPSMLCILLFLIFGRNKEENVNIQEKRMVLSGNIPAVQKLKYMACDAESELLCLAEHISYDYTLIVAAFYKERFFCDLNQEDIIYGINKYGALCTVKEYISQTPR